MLFCGAAGVRRRVEEEEATVLGRFLVVEVLGLAEVSATVVFLTAGLVSAVDEVVFDAGGVSVVTTTALRTSSVGVEEA